MDQLPESCSRQLEENYVRTTYESIAEDFSHTRYKKWPKVDEFLSDAPKDHLMLDIGCGNGKYLDNARTFNIGCDITRNLLNICNKRGFQVVQCDMMRLPFRSGVFDIVISVAALHHISTHQRRQRCLDGIIDLINEDNGKLFIQVWSYEQNLIDRNPYLRENRSGIVEGEQTHERVVLNDQVDILVHKNRTPFACQDLLVPFYVKPKKTEDESDKTPGSNCHLRYYHLFKELELDSMLVTTKKIIINESYHDKGNWCCVGTKIATP